MFHQVTFLREEFATNLTPMVLMTCVNPLVSVQLFLQLETFITITANVRFLHEMRNPHVSVECTSIRECFRANGTHKRTFTRVSSYVRLQIPAVLESFIAKCTFVSLF